MPFWRHYFHLVWSTKNRQPLIHPEMESLLYAYLIKKAAELGVYVYAINGMEDHIHIIAAISPRWNVAKVVQRLKGASSHYVNHVLESEEHFAWQTGYGSLTLGETQRARAEAYVRNQKQHHAEDTVNEWLERTEEDNTGPTFPPVPEEPEG